MTGDEIVVDGSGGNCAAGAEEDRLDLVRLKLPANDDHGLHWKCGASELTGKPGRMTGSWDRRRNGVVGVVESDDEVLLVVVHSAVAVVV